MPGDSALQSDHDSARRLTAGGVAALAAVALVLVATVSLWAHYGTAVFYEIIVAGLNACF